MNIHVTNRNQQGATLIVCMIILVVITLLGVGSIQDTTLEEKMAANMKNRNTAFQAAETALRDAEDYLDSIATLADFDGTGGYLGSDDVEPDYFDYTNTWTDANSHSSVNLTNPASPPRYIIKYFVEKTYEDNSPTVLDHGESIAGQDVTVFKITSLGTGGTDSSRVILQTFYGKKF